MSVAAGCRNLTSLRRRSVGRISTGRPPLLIWAARARAAAAETGPDRTVSAGQGCLPLNGCPVGPDLPARAAVNGTQPDDGQPPDGPSPQPR